MNIKKLLNETDRSKYDENHLLVLFKMYDYSPGVIQLCQNMGLREELLNYYV
jgi:hypothetical protein